MRGKLIERRNIYSGKIIELVVDTIEIGDRSAIREVVRHPGGVVVLAELGDGRIPFVRQHRYPMERDLLELPAGKRDPGEAPEVSAARELEEETGYRAEHLEPVFSYYPTPGFCDELLHFYFTDRLVRTETNREHDEIIELEFYHLPEALELASEGRIEDGKTLLALYWRAWKVGLRA